METQLKNDIKNNSFKNVYLLTGEEKYLTDYYSAEITNALVDEDMREFNYLKLSSLPDPEEIDAFANSYPFMSEHKVMMLKDTGIFKTSDEKIKGYFTELLESVPEYLTIIFNEANADKRSAVYKSAVKLNPEVEFNYKKPAELAPWLVKIFKKAGKNISSQDALYMCEIAGPSMLQLKSEAEKVITFMVNEEKADQSLIDSLVTRTVENRVFSMLDNLVEGKTDLAMEQFGDLKALGEEPIKIISIIFNRFATFHTVLIMAGKSPAEIASITGMRDWQIRNSTAPAKKLGGRKIASVMSKCRDMDFAVKNGLMEKWLALEMIIAEIIL